MIHKKSLISIMSASEANTVEKAHLKAAQRRFNRLNALELDCEMKNASPQELQMIQGCERVLQKLLHDYRSSGKSEEDRVFENCKTFRMVIEVITSDRHSELDVANAMRSLSIVMESAQAIDDALEAVETAKRRGDKRLNY